MQHSSRRRRRSSPDLRNSRVALGRAAAALCAGLGLSLGLGLGLAAPDARAASAPVFTSLYNFGAAGSDGHIPFGGLALGNDGNFYGTTALSGNPYSSGYGTVFKITPAGALTTLYTFASNGYDGTNPNNGLALGSDGNFYGTTELGGANNVGTVFQITPAGAETVLYQFAAGSNGDYPDSLLVKAASGSFYGTTGGNPAESDFGTFFDITSGGSLAQLANFAPISSGAANPLLGVIQGSDGNFYGTTLDGGMDFQGSVYKITPSGALTTLYYFSDDGNGAYPYGNLVQGTDGNLYGTTSDAGNNDTGTVFKITPAGALTTIYTFPSDNAGNAGGSSPASTLLLGTDGNFYGTTEFGGADDDGTVFQITPTGALTTLYSFTNGTDGENPLNNPLAQGAGGQIYGLVSSGGSDGYGTAYKIAVPSLAAAPTALTSLTLSPTTVIGGKANATATITLAGPAAAGMTLALASSNTAAATVPASVSIAAGATSAAFTVTSKPVSSAASVTISATSGSIVKTAALTVNPAAVTPTAPTLSSVLLSPASIIGGNTSTANRAYLSANATADTSVTITSSNTAVARITTTPITIKAGSSSNVFTIATTKVSSPQTVTITATASGVTQKATLTVTPASSGATAETRFDFNGDGHADLLLYNTGSGGISVWDMNDQQVLSYGPTFTSIAPSTGWLPVAAPDVNNDGSPDLLLWNDKTGEMSCWTVKNNAVTGFGADFATIADTNWKPVAAADVTGTTWEMVLQNTATGDISAWQMNGQTVTSYGPTLGSLGANSPWQVVGAPDLDGDGHSDLLFWNSKTGEVSWWGTNLAASQVLGYHGDITTLADTTWHLVGSEDTNGDGHPDLLWWNAKTGEISRWLLNGTTVTQYGGDTATLADITWQPTAIR